MFARAAPLLLVLPLAALLEVGGDAVIRRGLQGRSLPVLGLGALILFAYGVLVNQSPAAFGRLMGVYVAVFFVVAQLVDALAFGGRPSPTTLLGGGLIVTGGLLVAWGR